MEEDIKILEEIVEIYYDCAVNEEGYDMRVDMMFMKRETQALENLINRVKELDEAIDSFMKGKAYSTKQLENVNKNYIPKSKIREKIEELEKQFDFYAGRCHHEWQDGEFDGEVCDEIAIKISILKELLEE